MSDQPPENEGNPAVLFHLDTEVPSPERGHGIQAAKMCSNSGSLVYNRHRQKAILEIPDECQPGSGSGKRSSPRQ